VIAPIHVAATLLDPRLKDKDGLMADTQKDQGIQALRLMMDSTARPTDEQSASEEPPPPKRARLDKGTGTDTSHDFFDDLFTAAAPSSSRVTADQQQTYLSTPGDVVPDGDLLQYWKRKEVTLPCSAILHHVIVHISLKIACAFAHVQQVPNFQSMISCCVVLRFCEGHTTAGVGKVRPAGQIRPASSVDPARGGPSVVTL